MTSWTSERCEMELDVTDTNEDVLNRCKVHGFLVYGDAYVCEGYTAPEYRGEGGNRDNNPR